MKTCRLCGKSEPEVGFETQRRQCKPCRKTYQHVKKVAWYARNREIAKAKTKEWRDLNAARKKASRKAEYERDKLTAILAARLYRKLNPAKVNHWTRMKQCAKAQRVPAWLTSEDKWVIAEIYELAKLRTRLTGIEWHVDHIIPLRGKIVSGLHTPSNLQVIPEQINKVKRNNFAGA